MRVLVIDNYDSFTYNLVQMIGEFGAEVAVARNDAISLSEVEEMNPDRIVISPGPCTPREAGISVPLIRRFAGRIRILGVCLGHQCIGEAFGATVVRAPRPVHGKTSLISHDGKTIFRGLANPLVAVRYHSLVVRDRDLPPELEVSARSEDGLTMGLRHKRYRVEGVQFHPESMLTQQGKDLLYNFLFE
jgi:anthranilate synthase/aminodeoxychorismate synthase-like glutamine amidotransferase